PLTGTTATLPWAFAAAGTHAITAFYSGDINDKTSTSATSRVVGKDVTATALVSSASPSVLGQSVTFTATVSVAGAGMGTPNGTVVFKDGTTVLATVPVDSSAVATFSTSA